MASDHRSKQGLWVALTLSNALLILLLTGVSLVVKPEYWLLQNDAQHFLGFGFAGGVLILQSITLMLLTIPLWRLVVATRKSTTSSELYIAWFLARIAAVASFISGCMWTILQLLLIKQPPLDSKIKIEAIVIGAVIVLSSSASLMISFWPSEKLNMSISTNNAAIHPLRTPLLSPQHDADSCSTISVSQLHSTQNEENDALLSPSLTDPETPVADPALNSHSSPSDVTAHTTVDAAAQEPHTVETDRITGTRRLLQLANSQVGYLYAGCLVLLLRLPFSLAMPHFVSTTLSALSHGDFDRAHFEIVLLGMVGTLDALLDFWCIFLFGYANIRIVRKVRCDLWSSLLRQDVAFFDANPSGSLASRLQSDCSAMSSDLTWFFRFSLESSVRILGIAGYMMVRCPKLTVCAMAIIPLVALINKIYASWLAVNATRVQDALSQANVVAQEVLGNIRTVLGFGAEDYEYTRYFNQLQNHFELVVQQLIYDGIYYMTVSTFLINTLVQGTLLYVGSKLIARDELTPEVLLAFMLYQGQLQSETVNLFQSFTSLVKSSGAGDKVFSLLDRVPPQPATGSGSIANTLLLDAHYENDEDFLFPGDYNVHHDSDHYIATDKRRYMSPTIARGGKSKTLQSTTSALEEQKPLVQLQRITFAYVTRPSHFVLKDFSMQVRVGQTVALVGASGCGKTTVMNLLQRFYDPQSGRVMFEGKDLRTIDLQYHRRRNIGVVTQEPVLMDGTIIENILYGCHGASSDDPVWRNKAQEAATVAHADKFIQSFPEKYDTQVGERGQHLSGGQKQRIAIARAIIKRPRLLLLDEATSALDHESEQVVQRALDELLKERKLDVTTIVIAHRLRTVQSADKIAVLHQGQIVEWGSHAELLNKKQGRYAKMVERRLFHTTK